MLGRNCLHLYPVDAINLLPPVGFDGTRDILIIKKFLHAQRCNDPGMMTAKHHAHGLNIEMIVVVVREEYEKDARSVFEPDPRRPHPLRTYPGIGTHAFAPHRISTSIEAVDLNEKGRVIDKGNANPVFQ